MIHGNPIWRDEFPDGDQTQALAKASRSSDRSKTATLHSSSHRAPGLQLDPHPGANTFSRNFIKEEAKALLSRLNSVRPFEFTMPMVLAARISGNAQAALKQLFKTGIREMRAKIRHFLIWQKGVHDVQTIQRQFVLLKLKFNALLDQFDIFADVLSQRGENESGVWIAGLDKVAEDALRIRWEIFSIPAMVCYLDRGHGAAIRRVRTRLPGGKSNPVAVIRIPRERMVSNGIASSLVHEVGHQGSALLDLVSPLRAELESKARTDTNHQLAWRLLSRWISEILSDFWAMANLGITATTGLMGVLSLPAHFVFRVDVGDPHPFPWIRTKISLEFGKTLFPDPQWANLSNHWNQAYPLNRLKPAHKQLISHLTEVLPQFVQMVIHHQPQALKGAALMDGFPIQSRQPQRLRLLFEQWRKDKQAMKKARPTLVFAVIGQARADGKLSPEAENLLLTNMLNFWALNRND